MDERLLILLDEKFLPKEFDLFGLKLHHELVGNEIIWTMENPNDISYNIEVIKGYLEQKIIDFQKLAGIKLERIERERLSKVKAKHNFYLNKKIENEIKEASKNINKIDFKTIRIDGNIKKILFEPGYDFITLNCYFDMKSVKKIISTRYMKYSQVVEKKEDIREVLTELFTDDTFFMDYLYDFFAPITSILNGEPLVVDRDYIFFEFNIIPTYKSEKV